MANELAAPEPGALPVTDTPIDYLITTPPAHGSLVQAWISIARRPSRQNIAAWVRCGEDRAWGRTSLIVAAVLLIVNSIASAIFRWNFIDHHQPVVLTQEILNVVIQPIEGIALLLATLVGLALAMPRSFGSLGDRCRRVIPTVFLIQPIIYGVSIISHAFNFGTVVVPQFGSPIVLTIILSVIGFYSLAIDIQSGAVASAQSQVRVFVVLLLADVAAVISTLPIRLLLYTIFNVHPSFYQYIF